MAEVKHSRLRTYPKIKDNDFLCAMTARGGTIAKAWEVTDEFWSRVEPLIPVRQRIADQTYARKTGGGRKPKDPRLVFEGIVFVLRTGCQWKALPAERYGSASVIHARFLEWEKAGVLKHFGGLDLLSTTNLRTSPSDGKALMWQ